MEVVMPKVGLTMTEGTLTQWHKMEGDPVVKGELLFTFETEKSTLEHESPGNGVLAQIIVPTGQTVACYTPVAVIGEQRVSKAKTQDRGVNAARQPISPRARLRAREMSIDLSQVVGTGPDGAIRERDVQSALPLEQSPASRRSPTKQATPVAQRIAQELALDLGRVVGTGPDGRITREDVERAAEDAPTTAPSPSSIRQELSTLLRVKAQRLTAHSQTAPHVTLHTEADATELVSARLQINAELSDKISYNALLVAICAKALKEHPAINASWNVERPMLGTSEVPSILIHKSVNLGLAVDTPRGLLVPVLHDCDAKPLVQIHRELNELVARTLDGKASPSDLSGGTFTLTNLGMFDVDGFTPIINLPEAAILGVGRIVKKPVVLVDDKIIARQMMTLSLSFDHRVLDGAPAAKFLQRVKQLIERPFALVL